jgi:hypothetical protein
MNMVLMPFPYMLKIEQEYKQYIPKWIKDMRSVYNKGVSLSRFSTQSLSDYENNLVADMRRAMKMNGDPRPNRFSINKDACNECHKLADIFYDNYVNFFQNLAEKNGHEFRYQIMFHDYYIEALEMFKRHLWLGHHVAFGTIEGVKRVSNHPCFPDP